MRERESGRVSLCVRKLQRNRFLQPVRPRFSEMLPSFLFFRFFLGVLWTLKRNQKTETRPQECEVGGRGGGGKEGGGKGGEGGRGEGEGEGAKMDFQTVELVRTRRETSVR